jgi:hypothetical protein
MSFDCICGKEDIFLCDEPVTCPQCKRVYELNIGFYVKEPEYSCGLNALPNIDVVNDGTADWYAKEFYE